MSREWIALLPRTPAPSPPGPGHDANIRERFLCLLASQGIVPLPSDDHRIVFTCTATVKNEIRRLLQQQGLDVTLCPVWKYSVPDPRPHVRRPRRNQ